MTALNSASAKSATSPFALEHLIADLTLEEKASLLSGSDFWHTTGVDREGAQIPRVMVTDGPHGLRKQAGATDHLGLAGSVPATCFPTAAALGSTWDVDLLVRVGAALGRESAAHDVAVLLGPGANIKRSPLCGRNFEYLSEDPLLSGSLAAALITGVQSQGVGTSLKHFAVNNQESDRMRVSAEVDERALREIYLASFEGALSANPWTLMCSYNKVNGVYASQNHWLLTQVLRDEWGWDGVVMSDWGAVRDRVAGVAAGLDLEMPANDGRTDAAVVAAVRSGELDEALVDASVRRLLTLIERTHRAVTEPAVVDHEAHHALAREAATAGTVLLKNEPVDGAPLLPLLRAADAVLIGEFARTPRYQGAGSSLVNPTQLDAALGAFEAVLGTTAPFAAGFSIASDASQDEALRAEAVTLAAQARTTGASVVLFLGLPAVDESEGFDRTTLDLPANQVRLLQEVAAVNPRVIAVLSNGGAVSVAPWAEHAPAILEGWLGGQAGGSAVVDVLLGNASPSGKLAETIPLQLADTPSFTSFPGENGVVRYGESIFVGYRWYDTRQMPVAFPFGHGLSYTDFEIDKVTAAASGVGVDARVRVTARITNIGPRPGSEVVQVYIADAESSVTRPAQELKAFTKVHLAPGESREVVVDLDSRALAYWHTGFGAWKVESGQFDVRVGTSSRAIAAVVSIDVVGESLHLPINELTTVNELLTHPASADLVRPRLEDVPDDMASMVGDMPAIVVVDFGMGLLSREELGELIRVTAAS